MTWVAAAVAVTSLTYQIGEGEKAKKRNKKALRSQENAQQQGLLAAAGEEKRAAQANAKSRTPDVNSLLFEERAQGEAGAGSTILSKKKKQGGTLLGNKSALIS